MAAKKPILMTEHPATLFLNTCFYYNFKPLLPGVEDIYEKLHELHLKGKEKRSSLTYLSYEELHDFLKQYNPDIYNIFPIENINSVLHTFSVVLGWKQFKQIYKFQLQLLLELWHINLLDEKYETISREEINYLPCFNFYIEQEIQIGPKTFSGFFVYFDELDHNIDQNGQIHVLLIVDPKKIPHKDGIPMYSDYYNITLIYSYDSLHVLSKETGEILTLDLKPKEVLKMCNPNVFKQLGDNGAIMLITRINQMISYLCATNADFNRVKKPTKKPNLKRNKITDAEYEKWTLGDVYISKDKKVPHTYVGWKEDAYNRETIINEEEEFQPSQQEQDEEVYIRERKKGYHVRPHMRRAHWKFYWYGKKDGSEERVKRRKFVSAVYINATGEEIEIPTRETIKYRF